MPQVARPLSTTEIKAAKPKEKDYSLCDGGGLESLPAPSSRSLRTHNLILDLRIPTASQAMEMEWI